MHAANLSVSSTGRRDLKISLSPSMGTSSEPVYLTGKAVKRTPPSWQLLLPPASVADSPASPSCRRRSCEPVCLISSDPVCLISRNKRSQDISFSTSSSPWATTRHSKKIRWECSQGLYPLSRQPFVSSQWQSLSTTRFFPMTNHSELSHITQHHTTAQQQAKYPDICFHNFSYTKYQQSNQHIKLSSFSFGGISHFQQQLLLSRHKCIFLWSQPMKLQEMAI